jgi:very-short-patch-repair endonuclease
MTHAEAILWERLRDRKCAGYKFRRQASIGWYVVDFLCMAQSLILEVDGSIHEKQQQYDREREGDLKERGYRIIRFSNEDIVYDLDGVVKKIEYFCQNRFLRSEEYSPSPGGRKGGAEGEGVGG